MTFTTRKIHEPFGRAQGQPPSQWLLALKKIMPYLLKCGGLFVGLYGKWKIRHEEDERKAARIRILKKIAVILVAILVGVLILAGTVKALVQLRIVTLQTFLSIAGADLPADENGFTSILLLGAGDKDHDGTDLTDAMMVVSLDPWKTRSAVMLSLPRDLYMLSTEKMGKGRINELYRNYKGYLRAKEQMNAAVASMLAMKELGSELGRKLGLEIHHVVKVDFTAFVEGVNALGGVDITVPYDIVDPEYPGPNYTFETFEIRAGPQHLDGETALKYARSRHTTSDFGRSGRQQKLLTALVEKARSQGVARSPGTITQLLKTLSEHVETTMSFAEILGAARLGDRVDRKNIINMHLNIETGIETPFISPGGFLYAPPRDQFDGASVLLPVSIPEFPVTWKQLQTFVRFVTLNRVTLLSKPQVHILNAGAKTGAARLLGNELIRYGFEDVETDNASDDRRYPLKLPATVVIARTAADEGYAEFFADLLGLLTGPLHPSVASEKQGQVTIVLGTDYAYTPLQDLMRE